ncbi:DUF2971 domain-containing protein [Flavobacterium degerlachei]|uniref:DUF2971 domain-containing protein n=1 Tax=Flavobacterium degerlachei TaxID=229203 RepID=A0A1H3EAM3_9FLAO|nr:DUF2971 domain-containing protein [Flavobacterium degerlachei]SDX75705.1 hypothetical protein SAMN05444338_11492 [Flavobacterium degerlachei]
MEKNFLNFKAEDIDRPIFRFLTVERLFQIFKTHSNVLVSPKLWDDPFENHIMTSFIQQKMEDEKDICVGFRDNFYGQCWTQTRESDAMWRIYSPKYNGARITTTPRKLLQSLFMDTGNDINDYSCFLGKVNYYTTTKLREHLDKNALHWLIEPSGQGLTQSLLFKRIPFKHENEVRLLINTKFKTERGESLYPYRFNPLDIIDDVVFDPRINYEEFQNYKTELRKLHFKKRIVKSKLYDMPKFIIKTQF